MKTIVIEIRDRDGDEDTLAVSLLCTLEFKHYQDSRELDFDPSGQNLFLLRGATQCAVISPDGKDAVIGDAWCYREDRFDKRRGERESLAKALVGTRMTRTERQEVWARYLEKRPILKPRALDSSSPRRRCPVCPHPVWRHGCDGCAQCNCRQTAYV